MARHSTTERPKIMGNTRQRLLDAAALEFAKSGYAGANINAISTNAGYAKGTIYNYFSSKQALLSAVIDETAQIHLDFIIERVQTKKDPVERLKRFYQAGFDFVALYLPRASVLFNTINGSDENLKAHIFEVYQPMFQYVANEIIAPGIEIGVFKPAEIQPLAMLLMTIYLGTASHHDGNGHPWLDPKRVAELILFGLYQTGDKR